MSGLICTEEAVSLILGGELPAWLTWAACKGKDPAVFFPEVGQSVVPAVAICETCPVQNQCLDWALRNHEVYGVWGGTSQRQRARIKKRVA